MLQDPRQDSNPRPSLLPLPLTGLPRLAAWATQALRRSRDHWPRHQQGLDPDAWQIVTCGGYRRGRASFHDIDLLLTHPALDLDLLNDHDKKESVLVSRAEKDQKS